MYLYSVLGFLNVGLVTLMLLPYAMRKLNELFFKKKNGAYIEIMRALRKSHRYIGIALVASVLAHGWLALGSFRLHTGTLAGAMVLIMAVFALIFIIAKKKWAFKTHKALAAAFIALAVLHLVSPYALYYIFGV